MKKILIGLLALGSVSAFADDARIGATVIANKKDVTQIQVVAGTKADCDKKLVDTLANLKSLQKLVISASQCHTDGQYPYESEIEVFKY
jgi:hypothetical protein